MNKLVAILFGAFLTSGLSAQNMIIGKDTISLSTFKKEYDYGLKNNGIARTIESTQDFLLLQQFAAEQKIDTTADFREKLYTKESELRTQFFYPKNITDEVLNAYIKDNQTEKLVQIFMVPKTKEDTNNYTQIYNEVKSGKMTMDEAITKYTKGANPKAVFIKAGSIDNDLYSEVKVLANNSYTKLYDTPGYIAFAKVLNSRPSLGYTIFGTVSYPKNEASEAIKAKIYGDLKAGKTFSEVAKLYGSNDHEKQNAGVVMGSPTLPDEVYEAFKGKKSGYYTPEPILYGENYFVFNLISAEPYAITEKNREFYLRDLTSSLYGENLQDKMIAYLKSDPTYKEFPDLQKAKKSYQDLLTLSDASVLYQYKKHKTTAGDIKKLIGDKKAEAEKLSPSQWNEAFTGFNSQDLMSFYSKDFTEQKEIKKELNDFTRVLYSDYVFSKYLNDQIAKNPQWLTESYNKNKSKYMWENRAEGRVAIIADPKLTKEIEKEMKDPKKWEALKTKYYGKLNEKKQILVHFEKGEMSEDADVFTKYKVPFKTGVHQTKMEARDLVIAIEKILPPTQMTQAESTDLLKDAVTEEKLREIIAQQKSKTYIVIQPGFMQDLEKNFKK